MKRIITMIVLGVGGLIAAIALTLGALALAGNDLGDAMRPRLDQATEQPTHSPKPDDHRSPSATPSVDAHGSASASASEPGDDRGSGSLPGSGSGDSGSGSDHSGDDD
jgi:hypothetical protein